MLSSRGKRLGAYLLEVPLVVVTLGIGWLIWSLVVFSRGQTPAKQLLKMRIVRLEEKRAANWGWMALRELALKVSMFVAQNFIPVGTLLLTLWVLINGFVLLANDRNQTLWDKMLNTVVIDDPGGLFKPVSPTWIPPSG